MVDPMIDRSLGTNYLFNDEGGIHSDDTGIFDGGDWIGIVRNPHLARAHNRSNLCAALAVVKTLGIDLAAALEATEDYRGLPHRQQELGESGNTLFVDDSISTIPESTIAALEVYAGRDITVILGGYDRGIDYGKLVEVLLAGAANAVICLGDSGARIFALAQSTLGERGGSAGTLHMARSMEDAVSLAKRITPPGGVVLLSPAAPSYGYYRDYIERGHDFAAQACLSSA
jgi:UDP-N-acetylmuramoylalanine--D-glutamate ligase